MLASIALLSLLVLFVLSQLRGKGSRESGLPPGPPTLPIIGNIHQFPTQSAYLRFTEWSKQYGGIFSLKLASQTIIVISSPRLIRDFMDKRSGSMSDRPPSRIVDITTDGLSLAVARSGPVWKSLRRAVQQLLTREACFWHTPIQQAEATQMMYDLLKQPEDFFDHIQRQTFSIMLSTVCGFRSPRYADSVASLFFSIQHKWEALIAPGAHPPIDLIPALEYIPGRWASWKTITRDIRKQQRSMYFNLRDDCERRIREGRRNGCFLEDIIDQQEKLGLTRDMVGYLGGVCIEGGSATTAAYLHRFVLCISCYPDVQTRAQEEIDGLIGFNRVPTSQDIEHLPYIQAIIKEVHRFYTSGPLGIPHATTIDETIDGYFIPKGSTIFMNIYGIYHSEELYERPEIFNPERYLNSEFGTKPNADTTGLRSDLHFGSGRRICPGNHLANSSIIMNVINLLWGFDMKIADAANRDRHVPIRAEDFTTGIAIGPKPFKCNIQPRSEKHAALIREAYAQARPTLSIFEHELTPSEQKFVEDW
ncbi:unnamed protein product [Somion occarium]|uniref:Cytochrome P450 n=1 Tax=Somion occarium TaxID=3059160 RepID=A0ABP1D7I5_9APHY